MSRTNASGWVALAVVAAVFAAAVLIREAPGVRPSPVRPLLAARALPLVAPPLAVTPDPLPVIQPVTPVAITAVAIRAGAADGARPAGARQAASVRLLAEARTESLPPGVSSPAVPAATMPRPAAQLAPSSDIVVGAMQAHGASDAPLAARRLEILAPAATTSATESDANSRDADAAGAVKRAFDTAGRSIAGGVKTAGAAIRGVF